MGLPHFAMALFVHLPWKAGVFSFSTSLVDISTSLCYILHLLKLQQLERGVILKKRFETFTVLINRINRNIRKIKNQEMAEYNLWSTHISCLYYLYQSEGLTATDLCECCGEDKATISRSLDYLEKTVI